MDKRTLEHAFNAIFHEKESFLSFLEIEKEWYPLALKERVLLEPSKKLKKYLRFIDKVLLRYLTRDEEVVHSYIKGKSALTAIKAHVGHSHFYTTDIQSFFSNIRACDVSDILYQNTDSVPVSDLERYIPHLTKMMTLNDALPVGFPTSPQLSNAFLYRFDRALHSYCEQNNFTYTRYSDDIVISAHNPDRFEQLTGVIQTFLNEKASPKLLINNNKTRFFKPGEKVKILGLVVTPQGYITIDSKIKKQLESLLHFYVTDKKRFNKIVNETLAGKEHTLFGLLHYAKSINPEYLEKLQRKYGAYAVRTLMKDKWNG